MIRQFQFSGQSGLTGYARIWDLNTKIWNGTGFVTYEPLNIASYKHPVPEIGSSGTYSAPPPQNLPIGRYHVSYLHQAGASPAESDMVIFQANVEWDGSQIIDDLVIGASVADICNMALSHLGVGVEIAKLQTEASAEAHVCRRFYETARDATLMDFPWPFATRIAGLGLVEQNPNAEWQYSYRYPASALYFRKILSGTRNDTNTSRVKYKIAGDDTGRVLYTDQKVAVAEFVSRVTNPLRFSPDFVSAMSFRLAAYIAPRLTAGDAFKLGERALQLYSFEIRKAAAAAFNEESPDVEPESEFTSIRA